ncbi:hypothetical protein BOTBODRAFT_92212, partial [Botryobasidium botryosum FD-172 SS1]
LTPRFIRPYKIEKVIVPNASYRLELPAELRQHGISPTFHASLLRIHVPNDNRRFPGHLVHQISALGGAPTEWAVDRILSHNGKGETGTFEILWASGD